MPTHNSNRVEYAIDSGHIEIIGDGGKKIPAYWAHPRIGHRFSGICLLHDWWGMDQVSRTLANFFAQMGYYVIEPDLFGGKTASSPQEAMELIEKTKDSRYHIVDSTLSVLETHHRTYSTVAAVGIGMGGTLALEAAINRDDLEATVCYSGFPQSYMGQFEKSNTPILAIYGSEEPYVKPNVIQRFQNELNQTKLKDEHEVVIIEGADHQIFSKDKAPDKREISKIAINHTLSFLERYMEKKHRSDKATGY